MRPWKRIPNLRVDMDAYAPGVRLGDVEHFRLNNGQVSGVYREAIALQIWGALGYPVPRTSFAWVEAPNQWGEDIRVPYTLVEVYKSSFCDHAIEGGCVNMWESAGDLESLAGQCQLDECDETRLTELVEAANKAPSGPGFTAALAEWIDWDAYRTFQCLSWITATGDDYVHNANNTVLVERADGKMQLLPYSVDISAGQEWYPEVSLRGFTRLAAGCQQEPECWSALLARCDELLTQIATMDVVASVVAPTIELVAKAGMERERDDERARFLLAWYAEREAALRADPVWTSAVCTSDLDCADREDGLTMCDPSFGICVAPHWGCPDKCPDGWYCAPWGECAPLGEDDQPR